MRDIFRNRYLSTETRSVLHDHFFERLHKVRKFHHSITEMMKALTTEAYVVLFVLQEANIIYAFILLSNHISQVFRSKLIYWERHI